MTFFFTPAAVICDSALEVEPTHEPNTALEPPKGILSQVITYGYILECLFACIKAIVLCVLRPNSILVNDLLRRQW